MTHFTPAQAAAALGCSLALVYRLVAGNELSGHRVAGKIVIDPASVEDYKFAHRFGPSKGDRYKPKPHVFKMIRQ